MRIAKAMLVFRKDWREIRRNWEVILPIVVVPLMISVLLPVIVTIRNIIEWFRSLDTKPA